MSTRSFLFSDSMADYVHHTWVREPSLLVELRAETQASTPDPDMQISPDLGQFLSVLIRGASVKHALEIGVFTGYSSTVTALALPDAGTLTACDVNETFTAIARRYWERAGVSDKIDLRLGQALDTLDSLIAAGMQGHFDFALIDADKGNYWNYFDRCLHLLRPGGMIAADNVLWSGRVYDAANQEANTVAIREFNRRVHEDPRVVASLVPIGDGLTLATKL